MIPSHAVLSPIRRELYEKLVRDHYQRIYGYLHKLCGEVSLAEDLCQDTYLKAWRHLEQFSERSSHLTWLLKIARNTWLDHAKRKTSSLSQTDSNIDALPDPATPASQRAMEAESMEQLQRAVDQLPEKEKSAILLHYREGLSYREIAKVMSIPSGTIKYHVSQGLAKLRECLDGKGAKS